MLYLGLIQGTTIRGVTSLEGRIKMTRIQRKLSGARFCSVTSNTSDDILVVSYLLSVMHFILLVLQLFTVGTVLEYTVTSLCIFLVFLSKETMLYMALVYIHVMTDSLYTVISHRFWRQFCG